MKQTLNHLQILFIINTCLCIPTYVYDNEINSCELLWSTGKHFPYIVFMFFNTSLKVFLVCLSQKTFRLYSELLLYSFNITLDNKYTCSITKQTLTIEALKLGVN